MVRLLTGWLAGSIVVVSLVGATVAAAQDSEFRENPSEVSGESRAAPGSTLSESAEAASKAADEAAAQLEAARAALEAAEQRALDAKARAEEEAARAADPVMQAQEAAARAEARAEEAERRAMQAQERALRAKRDAHEAQKRIDPMEKRLEALENRIAYDRSGFYVGVGAALAPETFGEGISGDDSRGLWARAGYRFHEHGAVELRGDWLKKFNARGNIAEGSVQPYAATFNVRAFPWTGRVQPYVGLGFGVMSARIDATRFSDGLTNSERRTTGVLRGAAGLDIYLSSSVLLNFDAAYLVPHDELREFRFATLGAGVEFRF